MSEPPATPFTKIIERAGSELYSWFEFNGFKFADIVRSAEEDVAAGRDGVAVQDVSPMMKFLIKGPAAGQFLDRISTRRLGHLRVGRVSYFLMVTEDGFIRDDGTAYRLSDDTFLVQSVSDLTGWLDAHKGDLAVFIEQVQTRWAEVSIYGKEAAGFLKRAGIKGLEGLKPFNFLNTRYGDSDIIVSRTGFSGGLGYELLIPWQEAEIVLSNILRAGGEELVTFTGNYTGITLRLDIGFLIPGWDFPVPGDDDGAEDSAFRTPYDMGWDWLVEFKDRGDFVGRQALQSIAQGAARYDLFAIMFNGEINPEDFAGGRVYNGAGDETGLVFTGGKSPTFGQFIGFANINKGQGEAGEVVTVGAQRAPGKLTSLPLIESAERGQTPPPGV